MKRVTVARVIAATFFLAAGPGQALAATNCSTTSFNGLIYNGTTVGTAGTTLRQADSSFTGYITHTGSGTGTNTLHVVSGLAGTVSNGANLFQNSGSIAATVSSTGCTANGTTCSVSANVGNIGSLGSPIQLFTLTTSPPALTTGEYIYGTGVTPGSATVPQTYIASGTGPTWTVNDSQSVTWTSGLTATADLPPLGTATSGTTSITTLLYNAAWLGCSNLACTGHSYVLASDSDGKGDNEVLVTSNTVYDIKHGNVPPDTATQVAAATIAGGTTVPGTINYNYGGSASYTFNISNSSSNVYNFCLIATPTVVAHSVTVTTH